MPLRRLIQENFWLKLVSIILAICLWFVIRISSQTDSALPNNPVTNPTHRSYELPVYVLTDPADGQIFKISPDTITVQVTGESVVLREHGRDDFKAYIDLTKSRLVETNMKVRLHAPSGVNVIQWAPKAVDVEQISP